MFQDFSSQEIGISIAAFHSYFDTSHERYVKLMQGHSYKCFATQGNLNAVPQDRCEILKRGEIYFNALLNTAIADFLTQNEPIL